MNFKKIEAQDVTLINPYFLKQSSRMSDFSFGTLFIWSEYLGTEYCISDETLFIRFVDKRRKHFIYAYPITQGDIREAILKIDNRIAEGHPFLLAAVPEDKLSELEKHFNIDYHYKREWSDYLYDAAEFREFKGKKYHDKRNHISRFMRDYGEFTYEPITKDNIAEAVEVAAAHVLDADASFIAKYEHRLACEVITKLSELMLTGGLIRTGGRVVAIAAGEQLGDTLFVHIEKALREYNGVYSVIAKEFAKQFPSAIYINREDDGGDEGLRRSKESYNPIGFIDKYIVHIKGLKVSQ